MNTSDNNPGHSSGSNSDHHPDHHQEHHPDHHQEHHPDHHQEHHPDHHQEHEQLSMLVDDELHSAATTPVLDRLLKEPAARARWERYFLISDTLKRSLPAAVDHGLAERVRAALEHEPAILAPRVKRPSAFMTRVAGFAVAASVAAIGVLGVQHLYQQDGQVASQEQLAQLPSILPSTPQGTGMLSGMQRVEEQTVLLGPQSGELADQSTPGISPNLNRYLVDHSQQTARGVQGVMPYARIVIYPNTSNTQR